MSLIKIVFHITYMLVLINICMYGKCANEYNKLHIYIYMLLIFYDTPVGNAAIYIFWTLLPPLFSYVQTLQTTVKNITMDAKHSRATLHNNINMVM